MPGPLPKRASQRRRRNKPKSYGQADPTVIEPAEAMPEEPGFDAHPIVASLWSALSTWGEAQFYSAADWQRARLELWFGNQLLTGGGAAPGAQAWRTFQAGLTALLISPAENR